MRILFTSIGRRVELVQAFRQAAEALEIGLLIYGADAASTAPALFFCDRRIQVPRISAPEYIPELVAICKAEKIDALIPTIDTDLFLLAQNKQAFADIGTRVVISDTDTVRICRDKRLTVDFFFQCGLKAPMTVDRMNHYTGDFPCFIKPMNGSSSIDALKIDNQADLQIYTSKIFDYVLQPYIEGTEYTVDVFCDFSGNPIYITPRERLAVRGGEVVKTKIVQDDKIIEECQKLIEMLKPSGAITVQLIRQAGTGEDYYIEINPRFGGGSPLSMEAGAHSAHMMLRLLKGETVRYQPKAARDGAVYSRFDQSVCVENRLTAPISAIVFDLDDTLYAEKDYIRSGYREVATLLPQIPDAYERLWSAFKEDKPAIDTLLIDTGLHSEELKRKCLEVFRRHEPVIELYPGVREMFVELRRKNIKLGILTDGRPEGQWKKICALGLEKLVDVIVVTDELGGRIFRKPNDIAFRMMQRRLGMPFEQMIYVGDNLRKDFTAPIALRMQVLYFDNPDGLYSTRHERDIDEKNFYGIVVCKEELVQTIKKIGGQEG